VYSRVVSTDLLFTGFLSLALFAFWQGYRGYGWGWNLLLYVSIGLAVMTKGVIGVFLPGLIVAVFLALSGEILALKRLGLWWGIPLAMAIALPWHLVVALRHEDFLRFYVVDNHVLRFLGQRAFVEDDVPLSLAAFLLATATLFGPWSIFLPAAMRETVDRLRESTLERDHCSLLRPVTPEAGALRPASFARPGDPHRTLLEGLRAEGTQAIGLALHPPQCAHPALLAPDVASDPTGQCC
jgi:4-amino-4-deoxy-L-arabinose transferase-like glycosyltransferase